MSKQQELLGDTETSAIFSPCRGYRYVLTRIWNAESPAVAWIGLNPSTADETMDDPTIRRCMGFARQWGCGGIIMLNLFAYRSTDPRKLHEMGRAACIGRKNDKHIRRIVDQGHSIVAAWGAHGALHGRGAEVSTLVGPGRLKCLGTTKDGHPRHPLYLRADTLVHQYYEVSNA